MLNPINFMDFIDQSTSSYIVVDFQAKKILYTNQSAQREYGIYETTLDIEPIFSKNERNFVTMFSEEIKSKGEKEALITNVLTLNQQGDVVVIDLHLGYFNLEEHQIYIEIIPKITDTLEIMKEYINHSSKPSLILNFDKTFSLFYYNERTKNSQPIQDFSSLSAAFLSEEKDRLISEVLEHFKEENTVTYHKKLQLLERGVPVWYSLALDKLDLEKHGLKLICNLTYIQEERKKEEELDNISQYFNILQSLCKGVLYRFDIKNRTLYRNEETAKKYNLPLKAENFPTKEWLSQVMPPDDHEGFSAFMDRVSQGTEGSHDARFSAESTDYQYHRFTFKAIRNEDGSIKEMVGSAMNIHHLKEAQNELDILNQYFAVIQEETQCLIYRYDIKNRILHRNSILAEKFGFPLFTENYPDEENLKRVSHPDDYEKFSQFFQTLLEGKDSSVHTRIISIDKNFEHHKLTGSAICNSDGSIREMLLTTFNIHKAVSLDEKEKELQMTSQYFGAIQELSDDLLYRIDIHNKTLIRREKKDGQANLFGMNIVATNFPESVCEAGYVHPDDVKSYLEFGHNALKGLASTVEVRMKSRSGTFDFRRIICVPVLNELGEVREMMGKMVNIQTMRTLEEMANFDALTHTLNKRAMLESTSKILSRASSNEQYALFFIDLDDFKYVNDNLGHSFGDTLLRELGSRLKDSVRYHDLVGRVGGDEFVIFLRDVPNTDMLLGKAKLLLSSISEDVVEGEKRHSIQGSVGIALFPHHGTTYEELYHHADLALYRSKHKGKNQVTLYSDDMEN